MLRLQRRDHDPPASQRQKRASAIAFVSTSVTTAAPLSRWGTLATATEVRHVHDGEICTAAEEEQESPFGVWPAAQGALRVAMFARVVASQP